MDSHLVSNRTLDVEFVGEEVLEEDLLSDRVDPGEVASQPPALPLGGVEREGLVDDLVAGPVRAAAREVNPPARVYGAHTNKSSSDVGLNFRGSERILKVSCHQSMHQSMHSPGPMLQKLTVLTSCNDAPQAGRQRICLQARPTRSAGYVQKEVGGSSLSGDGYLY